MSVPDEELITRSTLLPGVSPDGNSRTSLVSVFNRTVKFLPWTDAVAPESLIPVTVIDSGAQTSRVLEENSVRRGPAYGAGAAGAAGAWNTIEWTLT